MLDYYKPRHKRWKDRSLTKRIRRLLNTVVEDDELPSLDDTHLVGKYNAHDINVLLAREWWEDPLLLYYTRDYHNRYLDKHLGMDAGEVHSKLSKVKLYRNGSKYKPRLQDWFLYELQYRWLYYRDSNNLLQKRVHKPYKARELPTWVNPKDNIWSHLIPREVKWDPSTSKWLGIYHITAHEYSYDIVTDGKGRPLFTKEEYQIHKYKRVIPRSTILPNLPSSIRWHGYGLTQDPLRTIPVGGPLLKETMKVITYTEVKEIPSDVISVLKRMYRDIELLQNPTT